MLALTRQIGQSIVIGKAGDVLKGPIRVTVAERRGVLIVLGIDAPRELAIFRDELTEKPRGRLPVLNKIRPRRLVQRRHAQKPGIGASE